MAPVPAKETVVAVELNKDLIRKKAYELSSQRRSYNDYIWLWAEAEMRLNKALQTDMKSNPSAAKIDVTKIVDKPDENDIKKLASDLCAKRLKVQDVHWFIAERQFVFDAAKGRK
nr:hypothetical protein [Candidatus Sigynarchaeota archaeon]